MTELNWTKEEIPASQLVRDLTVNPRDGSDAWARHHLERYHPGLLGLFIVSERIKDDTEKKEYVVLDGSNRLEMIELAGDQDRPVLCQVFHGLTVPEEARIARQYNERRQWAGVRTFLAKVTEGDPVAVAINDLVTRQGWRFDTSSANGVFRGVTPFEKLILTASHLAVAEAEARKGSERWDAAMESGRKDGLRVLEEALQVYSVAFPDRPSGYAGRIVYGISLLLLRDGSEVSLDRLTSAIRDQSGGHKQFLADIRSMKDVMRLPFEDAAAWLCIRFYDKGLNRNGKAFLDDNWTRMSR